MDYLISAEFICSFDSVKTYPYGNQNCSFSFFLTGSGKLKPGYVSYQGATEVGQYQISSEAWSIKCNPLRNLNNCRNCEIVKLCTVSVFLNRNVISVLTVSYVPSFLMNTINQASVYIKGENKYD